MCILLGAELLLRFEFVGIFSYGIAHIRFFSISFRYINRQAQLIYWNYGTAYQVVCLLLQRLWQTQQQGVNSAKGAGAFHSASQSKGVDWFLHFRAFDFYETFTRSSLALNMSRKPVSGPYLAIHGKIMAKWNGILTYFWHFSLIATIFMFQKGIFGVPQAGHT